MQVKDEQPVVAELAKLEAEELKSERPLEVSLFTKQTHKSCNRKLAATI